MTAPPLLEVRDAHVTLGGRSVITGVTLAVRRGEVVLLMGRSGTGKSVLVKAALGFLPLAAGTVLLDGDVVSPADDRLRSRVALVHQHPALFDEWTARENVAAVVRWRGVSRRTTADAAAEAALQRVGISESADRVVSSLSAGARKQVSVARALATHPDALVLDEPTTGLDVVSAAAVARALGASAASGTTLVIVTHDPDPFLAFATRVVLLHQGLIVANQPVESLAAGPPALAQLLAGNTMGPLATDAGA